MRHCTMPEAKLGSLGPQEACDEEEGERIYSEPELGDCRSHGDYRVKQRTRSESMDVCTGLEAAKVDDRDEAQAGDPPEGGGIRRESATDSGEGVRPSSQRHSTIGKDDTTVACTVASPSSAQPARIRKCTIKGPIEHWQVGGQ